MRKSTKFIASLFAAAIFSLAACDNKNNNSTSNNSSNSGNTDTPVVQPEKKNFTVTFNSNGGSSVNSSTIKENETAAKPADPTKEGFIFDGWYTDSTLTNKMDFSKPITGDTTLYAKWNVNDVKAIHVVSFETNGGSTIVNQRVEEGSKATKPNDPTRDGYKFLGWYSNIALTTEMNFDNAIVSNLTVYAKWEKIIENVNYGIVDRDVKIPTDVKFSTESHTSAHQTTINCDSLPSSGNYNQNFDAIGDASVIDGIKVIKYRYNKNNGFTLLADNSYYSNTLYHGREGAIFNVDPIGGINKITVSYSATYSSSQNLGYSFTGDEIIKPNIRFGTDPSCADYVYFLDPTASNAACNVNLSSFQYFSVCTGTYNLRLNTINIEYDDNATSSPTYAEASGVGKVRINPTKYTYSLVPGESKITVPLETQYNESTKTYTVTKSKELTYYTLDYVRYHSECKDDAAIIDPILIAAYYTAFKKFPANFEVKNDMYKVRDVFGTKARQVSPYSRTDGYVRAVPWQFQGQYYEFDIDIDGTYSSSRGSGRVVAWESGWSATGYDDSPVCIYTDDHYSTFIEYLNNGTWSNRFNAEGYAAGIKYSTPTTVTLSGFDPHMVEGTSGGGDIGGGGGSGEEEKQIDDNDYYANFAPEQLINENTAKFQQVTNISGINETNVYVFAFTNDDVRTYPYQPQMQVNNSDHSLECRSEEDNRYLEKDMYFELVSENTGYLYCTGFGYKRYLGFNEHASHKDISYDIQTLFTLSFDAYGNFNIGSNGYYLRNNTNNGVFRFYNAGSQQPIQLYRFCDIKGATPLVTNYLDIDFDLVTDNSDIVENGHYLLVSEKSNKAYNGTGKYIIDPLTKELKITEDSSFDYFVIEKHPSLNVYSISIGINYLVFDSDTGRLDLGYLPTYFNISFVDGIALISPVGIIDGVVAPVVINNMVCYIGYNSGIMGFDLITEFFQLDTHLYKLDEYIPTWHTEYQMVTNTGKLTPANGLLLVSGDYHKCYNDFYYGTFNISGDTLTTDSTFPNNLIYFEKVENENVYVIKSDINGDIQYISANKHGDVFRNTEPSYYFVEFTLDGDVKIMLAEYNEETHEYVNVGYKMNNTINYNPEIGILSLLPYNAPQKMYLFEKTEVFY